MKQLFIVLCAFGLLTTGCKQRIIDEPDHLIPPNKLENMLYDLSLLNSLKGVDKDALEENGIIPTEYLFKKYDTDSTAFTKSSVYYAAKNPEEYAAILKSVKKRLEAQRKIINDSIDKVKKENTKLTNEKDSLIVPRSQTLLKNLKSKQLKKAKN